jgi:hypothetical protein
LQCRSPATQVSSTQIVPLQYWSMGQSSALVHEISLQNAPAVPVASTQSSVPEQVRSAHVFGAHENPEPEATHFWSAAHAGEQDDELVPPEPPAAVPAEPEDPAIEPACPAPPAPLDPPAEVPPAELPPAPSTGFSALEPPHPMPTVSAPASKTRSAEEQARAEARGRWLDFILR